MKKRIVVTTGDPAGCGPLITLKALTEFKKKNVSLYAVGDWAICKRYPVYKKLTRRVSFIDVETPFITKVRPGYSCKISAGASVQYLTVALSTVAAVRAHALVTAPVSKEAVQTVWPHFSGHTELFASHYRVKNYAMMMVDKKVRIALLTRHIPLRDVANSLSVSSVRSTIRTVQSFLQKKYKIKKPRIVLASVNPHAGIFTYLEKEEKILQCARSAFGTCVTGPLPADTLYTEDALSRYDCIVAPYHDAAMIPFKVLSFTQGVNVTCGLPIIRTSPAHGVAFDCMRKGITPMHSSMHAALSLAYQFIS